MAARTVQVTRPRKPAPVSDIDKHFHDFVYNRHVASAAGKVRDKARDRIKKWFDGPTGDYDVTVNENGSRAIEFDEPILIDGEKVTGLENVRSETSTINLDLVDGWLESLPVDKRQELASQLYVPVTDYVFQPDALFRLQQEGVISEDQLDKLYSTEVGWSLTVKKD